MSIGVNDPSTRDSGSLDDLLAGLTAAAADPLAYARAWKATHDGAPIVGVLPMNLPVELVIAAGALPIVLQESREPITVGRNLLFEFHCGYTRSLVDQAALGEYRDLDGLVLADQCVQLQSAVDVMQGQMPEVPVRFGQFIASMDERGVRAQIAETVASLTTDIAEIAGAPITAGALSDAIRTANVNRTLLRELYALRRTGATDLSASQMQVLVKSSMVMDRDEHTQVLRTVVDRLRSGRPAQPRVRLHLSGHFCHAPRPELLDLIEECGAVVADDDLYTGYRYISTDIDEDGDPFEALARWYMDRNVAVPCPTRVQKTVDWDRYLLDAIERSDAAGVIVLMAKFCEPHMLYYPELRRALDAHGIPHLLIETEHEGLPTEALRTRVETLLERIRRSAAPVPAAT